MKHVTKRVVLMTLAMAVLAGLVATGVEAKSENSGKGKAKSAEMKLKKENRGPKMFKRIIPGKVAADNVVADGSGSLKIRKGNKEYTVNTTTTTTFVNRKWQALANKTDVEVGHKVTVKGTLNKETMTIEATWVRVVSLPAKSTTEDTE